MSHAKNKLVYVGMVGDMLHVGHVNIIEKAHALGRVVVGLLTDEAVASYKRVPLMRFEDRMRVVQNLANVDRVVPQFTHSYRQNLLDLKPDYVVHGDDWRHAGPQSATRAEVIQTLADWGGELVEIPYTEGVSSTLFHRAIEEQGATARARQSRLRWLLKNKPCVRIIEAHNGLSALIAHRAEYKSDTFHALWQSSFTDAASRAKPDIEIVDTAIRLLTINEIQEATPQPVIYDGDTGGNSDRVYQTAKSLNQAGVAALCLEDKIGAKRNSIYGTTVRQQQADTVEFCEKIGAAREAMDGDGMMFISRIESFVLGAGLADAIGRAEAYVEAGSDGILIHSISQTPDEVMSFTETMRRNGVKTPIFVVPTTYGRTKESDLSNAGINAVIYANHLLRACYPSMAEVAQRILQDSCAGGEFIESRIATMKQLLDLMTPGPQPGA